MSGSVFQRTDLCPDCQQPIQLGTHSDCPSFRVGASNGADTQAGIARARASLAAMDNGQPQPLVRAVAKEDRPCKRCGAPARKPPVTNGPYAYLCDEHYAEQRTKMSQAQYEANAKRGRGRERAAETESPSQQRRLQVAREEPAADLEPRSPGMRIVSLGVQLGDWKVFRDGDDCYLDLGHLRTIEGITWEQLEQLPALIAAVRKAFGANE